LQEVQSPGSAQTISSKPPTLHSAGSHWCFSSLTLLFFLRAQFTLRLFLTCCGSIAPFLSIGTLVRQVFLFCFFPPSTGQTAPSVCWRYHLAMFFPSNKGPPSLNTPFSAFFPVQEETPCDGRFLFLLFILGTRSVSTP